MKPALPLSSHLIKAHEGKLKPLYERYERNQSLHPSILITGLEGVGKKSMVLYFLQYLFCDQSIFAQNNKEEETQSLFGDAPTASVAPSPIASG